MVLKLYTYLISYLKSEDGAETVEYALVVGLFAIAAVVAIAVAGTGISTMFTAVGAALTTAAAGI